MVTTTEIKSQYLDVLEARHWLALDSIVESALENKAIIDRPSIGDSRNEAAKLGVIRLVNRIDGKSLIVNASYTQAILAVFRQAKLLHKLEAHYSLSNLKILRMQFNTMHKDAFIDTHTDSESDPNYLLTVVVRTASTFTGGDFIVSEADGINKRIKQPEHSVFVFDSSCEHSVERVESGCRNSIALFVGSVP